MIPRERFTDLALSTKPYVRPGKDCSPCRFSSGLHSPLCMQQPRQVVRCRKPSSIIMASLSTSLLHLGTGTAPIASRTSLKLRQTGNGCWCGLSPPVCPAVLVESACISAVTASGELTRSSRVSVTILPPLKDGWKKESGELGQSESGAYCLFILAENALQSVV